jgi:hypothetical protein
MGRHSKPENPSFMSRLHLPSREAVTRFGVKAGIFVGLGVVALLGAKQMYDVSMMPTPETAGESLAQLDDKFFGIAKGAGLFALSTLGSVGFAARLSSVRHGRQTTAYHEFSLSDAPEEASYGRHAALEPGELDESVRFDAEVEELLRSDADRVTDTLYDLEPIPAAV